MKRNGLVTIIVILLIIIAGLLAYYFIGIQNSSLFTNSENGSTQQMSGNVIFVMKDPSNSIKGVSHIYLTVDSIKVHSETKGWITISSQPQTEDLLELNSNGNQVLLAKSNLEAGTYNQIKMQVSQVSVVDNSGKHDSKMPSNNLKINANINLNSNETSTATFDFKADESLHETGNGNYVFAPVLNVETRENANVDLGNRENVVIRGGNINTNINLGMDVKGNLGIGLGIPENSAVSISSNGSINLGNGSLINGNSNSNLGIGF